MNKQIEENIGEQISSVMNFQVSSLAVNLSKMSSLAVNFTKRFTVAKNNSHSFLLDRQPWNFFLSHFFPYHPVTPKKNTLFFKALLGSQQSWRRRYRDLTSTMYSIPTRVLSLLQLMNLWWHITSSSPKFHMFTLGIVPSMGFDKCITWIHYYGTIQCSFTALKILLCSTYSFLLPANPWLPLVLLLSP